MAKIYEPQGKAREYSPFAFNVYEGCSHKCKYCYVPELVKKYKPNYTPGQERRTTYGQVENLNSFKGSKQQVLLCFMTDPYTAINQEYQDTRTTIRKFIENKIPFSILTKSKYALNDLDIIKEAGPSAIVGYTLTLDNDKDSLYYEPGACLPGERINALAKFKNNGVRTWASLEPVLKPEQSINLIKLSWPGVDFFKLGKLNHYTSSINWKKYLYEAVELLREYKKPFYIKKDLAIFDTDHILEPGDTVLDAFTAEPYREPVQENLL
jgi:hypothetical protein